MAIGHLVDKFKDELPGYKISGYVELCIPIFKRTLNCLMQTPGQLPVVSEFVLNFSNLNVDKNDIAAILGLDLDLIEQAWWELVYHEFINPRNGRLTQEGYAYLEDRRLDKRGKALIPVCIDGLIGTIKKDNFNLMKKQDVRENGLQSIFPLISPPNSESIDFHQVKSVINEYKKIDEEFYDGELIEIVDIKGSTTFYKQMNLLFYSDDLQKNSRIIAYDGLTRVEEYERALNLDYVDNNQELVLKSLTNEFPEYDLLSQLNFPREEYGPGEIFDNWIKMIDSAKRSITISLPLINSCVPSDLLIDCLSKALMRNVSIIFLASGYEFNSKYQKNQYDELFALAKKHSLKILQIPILINKSLIIDESTGIISDFKRTSIYLGNNKVAKTYVEIGYILNNQEIVECNNYLIGQIKTDLFCQVPMNIDKKWLLNKIRVITGLVNSADEKMKSINGLGWLGDSIIPNEQSLKNVPIALNESSFMTFITTLSISITESISSVKYKYLWNGFKEICPVKLFHLIEKIRTYRNYCDHITLDEQNRKRFLQYISEDLLGCLPQFVPNGFLHLQVKLLNELENELRRYIER